MSAMNSAKPNQNKGFGHLRGAVSSMCWYVSYRLGLINADIEPSMTIKFLLPLALTPVTVLTSAALVATMDLPGSMMIVNPRSSTTPRMVSIKSFGVGNLSPLHQCQAFDIYQQHVFLLHCEHLAAKDQGACVETDLL